MTYAALLAAARRAAAWAADREGDELGYLGLNSVGVPLLLFASAMSGKRFVPLNYRLADHQLAAVAARLSPATVIADDAMAPRIADVDGITTVSAADVAVIANSSGSADDLEWQDPDSIAVLLFTSGTTGDPKAAVLRQRHLFSYVISTVELGCAGQDEAALVSVPPYHIAGISAVLTSVYAGRRLVYLPSFDPDAWVTTVASEAVTHAMVVPTMLGRVLDAVGADPSPLKSLRHLSYGGGRMPAAVIERALTLLPDVDFVNAYGLTETSSTIAVLGPDDHRAAIAGDDAARRRLSSVGRPLPGIEIEIRDHEGQPLAPGGRGEIHVRGEQVSGEYLGGTPTQAGGGWFATNDAGMLDADGFLYLDGRLDDVIVRGGENLSPGEIESVLVAHPAVRDAAVVGVPDPEWGERVVAAVAPESGAVIDAGELQAWVRSRLRSSRTPEHIEVRDELPYNEMGKLLRRVLRAELAAAAPSSRGGRTG
jgi:acyl-CoA synthetase (AMP-forming)/AMP-acid ligase II